MIVNGVTLPDIPADVLAQYPYCVVALNLFYGTPDEYVYCLLASPSPVCVGDHEDPDSGMTSRILANDSSDFDMYYCPVDDASEWTFLGSGNEIGGSMTALQVSADIKWSNHDIEMAYITLDTNTLVSTTTPTGEIYFHNSEVTHPERVSIGRSLMDKIANEVQRLTGISDQMNAETIRDWMKVLEVAKGIRIGDATAPPILADDLAQYPYVVLFQDHENGTELFYLVFAKDFFFHVNPGVISGLSEEYIISSSEGGYRVTGAGGIIWGAWNGMEGSAGLPVSSTLEVVWSNHDIHELTSLDLTTGDYTTGDLYFPPLEAIDSDRVSIGYDLFNSIVTDIQRLTGITEQMNALKAYWWLTTIVALS